MKRFATYIAVLAAMVFASACTMNELLEPNSPSDFGDDVVTISPRISHFMDCNVSTRSAKEGDEGKVTSMAMALFPIQGGVIQPSVFYQYNADGNMLFVLDRNKAPFVDANYEGQEFVMYIIANMQGSGIPEISPDYTNASTLNNTYNKEHGIGWTPAEFVEKAHTIVAGSCFEQIGDNGLPMLGSLGDYLSVDAEGNKLADGKYLIFMPEKVAGSNDKGLPTVDGTPTDNLEIPMRALYAKVSFTIEVDSDQEIVGNAAPRFDLKGYQVNNAAGTVYLTRVLNVDDENTEYEDVVSSEFHNVEMDGLYAQGAKKATFHCYVPERYLTPATLPSAYTYDFGENGSAITGYENIPAELKKYAQRFKPMLVSDAQKATHVAINGTFTDHQKHVYDVTYKIFLGSDNYGNFDIIRNTHYNNVITIRGINNSDDQPADYDPSDPGDDAPISIDHRVTIDRTTPLVVGLRRETLLDAHFEVRPLRLHLSGGDHATNPTRATVTLKKAKDSDPALSTWIGMELSGTSVDHITGTGTPSDGKRKYFTTDLISSISGNTSLTVEGLNYNANQTIWLYVDENISTTSRSAVLQIEYNYKDPVTQETAAPTDYIITQYGLHEVTNDSRTYHIENFEEYLYNYDVEDVYGQTKEEGMPWGLDGVQLSKEHYSYDSSELTPNVNWTNYEKTAPRPYYDFYTWAQDSTILKAAGFAKTEDVCHNFAGAGQHFTEVIAKHPNSGVKYFTLGEQANSAVEYCYNRNKRNPDGTVKVEWYLPSADELEDFIVAAYSTYKEFQDNYYWTSQPAYIRNMFYYEYQQNGLSSKNISRPTVYDDNTKYARATKVVHKDGNFEPAKSGLNPEPEPTVDNRSRNGRGTYENVGYFYVMHFYKRYYQNFWSSATEEYGPDKTNIQTNIENGVNVTNGDYDEWYDNKYYVHLGHLDNLMQEGYHKRTKKNRVRCAYKKVN